MIEWEKNKRETSVAEKSAQQERKEEKKRERKGGIEGLISSSSPTPKRGPPVSLSQDPSHSSSLFRRALLLEISFSLLVYFNS